MDYQHVLAFVEAIDGADFYAIHVFATDARFCDDIGHGDGYSPELYKPSRLPARSDRRGNSLPENAAERWLELNRDYAAAWPNITRKKPYPADADQWKDVPDKYDKYFTPNPGGS